MSDKLLLSGNEAIAHGARDAGARIGVGYPGTPSTETLECFARFDEVYAEWCTNEKVAMEVALGASCAGARSLVTMKHVGVNVAADPLFTAAYTGVGGGLVVLAADDPGMHSSQNEQDTHYYGAAAHIPVMDPADSQEAYDFAREAFELSERFDVPVIVRSTVRISHTKTPVALTAPVSATTKPYEKQADKWVMMPLYAKVRRQDQLKRIEALNEWVETCPFNTIEHRGSACGIICSGAVYQYVSEALPEASIMKLGVTYPLPRKALADFASSVDQVYVLEETSTYLEEGVRALGITVAAPPQEVKRDGELSPEAIRAAFACDQPAHAEVPTGLPPRPPALCPGCPHRLVFRELSRLRAIVTGDIGCYTLGALPPLSAMDTCVDMGASVSMAHGMELGLKGQSHKPVVGIIGDSTFAHSGLSSLISTVYNNGTGTICILDNRTTAMTGRQGNPFNGVNLQDRPQSELDLEGVVRAIGVEDVRTIDPNDQEAVRSALKSATSATDVLSVLIFKHPCVLLSRERHSAYHITDCTGCGVCISLGCPAIGKEEKYGHAYIDAEMCIGCGQCAQYCKFNCIDR